MFLKIFEGGSLMVLGEISLFGNLLNSILLSHQKDALITHNLAFYFRGIIHPWSLSMSSVWSWAVQYGSHMASLN